MRWFLNNCGQPRENISLLVGGVLAEGEIAAVKTHLATCATCQKYHDELTSITMPLANWETTVAQVEANNSLRARWDREFQSAIRSASVPKQSIVTRLLDCCRDIFWPSRRIWTAFAAIWLAIFALNFSTREKPQTVAHNASQPSPEMVLVFLEREGLLPALSKRDKDRSPKSTKSPAPAPRSERRDISSAA